MPGFALMLRSALRNFTRTPVFSAAIVGTLALGLGFNAALFSLAHALLIAPLPFPASDRLVAVWETVQRETVERREFSYPNFRDLAAEARGFEHLAVWIADGFLLAGGERSERVRGERVSGDYFRTLGVEPLLGRGFASVGPEPASAPLEVVLSEGVWKRRFGGGSQILGSALTVDGRPMTIVGVMPAEFKGLSQEAGVWVPIGSTPGNFLSARSSRLLALVGRLTEGATLASARAEVESILGRLALAYPDDSRGYGGTVLSLREDLLGSFRRPMLVLLGAVGLVLLIACANVANLLLIRVVGRRREAALQIALGANRRDRLAQTLVESLLPSLAAGALGLLLAAVGLAALQSLGIAQLPALVAPSLGGSTFVFSSLLAVLTGVVLGLIAELGSDSTALAQDLRDGGRGRTASPRGRRTRQALIVFEVACALVVSIGAGLLAKSLRNLNEVDPHFDPRGLQILSLDLSASGEGAERRTLAPALLDRIAHLPGVQQASLSSDLPLGGDWSATTLRPEVFTPRSDEPYEGRTRVHQHRVSPSFFDTLGMRLVRGRGFNTTDNNDGQRPVLVAETLARHLWPGEDPLGKRLQLGRGGSDEPWFVVIGVVADVRYRSLTPGQERLEDPDLYRLLDPGTQAQLQLAVRSSLPASILVPALRGEIERFSRTIAVFDVTSMEARKGAQLASARLNTLLLGLFALLALLLACVGIFSVLTHLIGQRRREVGIRLALGAQKHEVVLHLAREGLLLVCLGMVLGLAVALLSGRLLASQLYAVPTADAGVLAMAILLLGSLAAAACLLPMRSALAVDPAVSLRSE